MFFLCERERKREKYECGRETLIGCLPEAPDQGWNAQPRYVT